MRDLNPFLCGRLFQLIQIEKQIRSKTWILTSYSASTVRRTLSDQGSLIVAWSLPQHVRNGNTRSILLLEWTVVCVCVMELFWCWYNQREPQPMCILLWILILWVCVCGHTNGRHTRVQQWSHTKNAEGFGHTGYKIQIGDLKKSVTAWGKEQSYISCQ